MKIEELILYTSNLKEQLDFYTNVLEFNILHKTSDQFSLQIGSSVLTFKVKKNASNYHFAFNIPADKEIEALGWLNERVDILPYLGDEIADFESWNAKAIYFYDKDSNIVEFISRKNLKIYDERKFSSKSVLGISEIGLPTFDMSKTFAKLNLMREINAYGNVSEHFCALGNEEGMFIVTNPELKNWIPTDDKVFQSDFTIKGDYNFEFEGGKINILN